MFESNSARITRREAILRVGALSGLSVLGQSTGAAQPRAAGRNPLPPDFDHLVHATMSAFDQPGLALAVVANGSVALQRGYGVYRAGESRRVDEATLFGIASNTKAFTAAALALLVEAGETDWDTPVSRHLPDFEMFDSHVTREITLRDLLVHRSGLGLGAGDLMVCPRTTHTRTEIVHGLRHLKPVRGFRAGYAYDNMLYIVAGEIVAAIAGMSWEAFMTQRLFQPLGMTDCVPMPSLARNRVAAHARIDGPARGLGRMQALADAVKGDNAAACGGIYASARDLAKWLLAQLGRGHMPAGGRLWSADTASEMWHPHVIVSVSAGPTGNDPARSIFTTYALGWMVQDYRGEKIILHGGAIDGQISLTVLVPSRDVAFAILTNAEERGVLNTLSSTLLDHCMGAHPHDWLAVNRQKNASDTAKLSQRANRHVGTRPDGGPSMPLSRYAGVYRDAWYGNVVITHARSGLEIEFTRTPQLRGPLEPWGHDVFRTRFQDRNLEDALVTFSCGPNAAVEHVTMKAFSADADFSYDYQDLSLRPATLQQSSTGDTAA